MAKQLILISPPGRRLIVQVREGSVQSVPSAGDSDTHLIVEPGPRGGPQPPAQPEPKGEEPPPPLDITMSFVAGLPAALEPWRFGQAMRVAGSLSFADLARQLASAPADSLTILI